MNKLTVISRWLFGTYGQLKKTAGLVGAVPVGGIFTELPDHTIAKIKTVAAKLV